MVTTLVEKNSMSKTTRVQMELPEKSMDRLKRLKDASEASSYTEVAKNAFRLYEKMIELYEQDNKLLIEDADGNMKRLELFY